MRVHTLSLITESKEDFIEITDIIADIVNSEGVQAGAVTVYIPHTTAGVMINENADPDVSADIKNFLNKTVPEKDSYLHIEGNSAAHIKAVLTGSSVTIPVSRGKMLLGRWQGIYFCEFDGPRKRSLHITI